MLDLAIICSTFPVREKLLQRSLETWRGCIESSELNCNIFIYDQGNQQDSYRFENNTHWNYVRGVAGSHIAGYNYWVERVEAKKYLFTHPDILFSRDTVRVAYETAEPNTFAAFKVFWMPEEMTKQIDKYDWRNPETLEDEMALYPLFNADHGEFYWNKDVRDKTEWHSTTTFCMDSILTHEIYPMPDLAVQGYDDPLHYMIRMNWGVKDVCIMNPVLMHQWHPSSWNGNAELAVTQARQIYAERYAKRA